MSAATRIKRATYATPRKDRRERFAHISTNYAWLRDNPLRPSGPVSFRKASPGNTFRRGA